MFLFYHVLKQLNQAADVCWAARGHASAGSLVLVNLRAEATGARQMRLARSSVRFDIALVEGWNSGEELLATLRGTGATGQ